MYFDADNPAFLPNTTPAVNPPEYKQVRIETHENFAKNLLPPG